LPPHQAHADGSADAGEAEDQAGRDRGHAFN